jgi:hypothetical protein
MSYYKIGDRVRVIQVSPGSKDIEVGEVGDEGTIVNLISAHLYRITLDNGPSLDLNAQQFEKVV